MGVVTPSGGACDLISDLAEEVGLELPEFAPETVERLQSILPAFSTCHNPLDVTGYVVVDSSIQRRVAGSGRQRSAFRFCAVFDGDREQARADAQKRWR